MKYVVEPGEFELMVGNSSRDQWFLADYRLLATGYRFSVFPLSLSALFAIILLREAPG